MEIKLAIDEVTPDFLKIHGVSFRAFKEVFTAFIPRLKIQNYKFTTDLTESEALDIFYNLPLSKEITTALFNKIELNISEENKEEFRKQISLYIIVSTLLKLKRRVADPILKLLYNRKGNFRLIGPIHSFVRKLAKEDGEIIDNETMKFVTAWDFFIRSNISELDLKSEKKNGRPSNKLEDYLLCEIKKVINSNSKHYMNDLVEIVTFLKESYDPIFSELPVSADAIKKSLQNILSNSNDTSSRN